MNKSHKSTNQQKYQWFYRPEENRMSLHKVTQLSRAVWNPHLQTFVSFLESISCSTVSFLVDLISGTIQQWQLPQAAPGVMAGQCDSSFPYLLTEVPLAQSVTHALTEWHMIWSGVTKVFCTLTRHNMSRKRDGSAISFPSASLCTTTMTVQLVFSGKILTSSYLKYQRSCRLCTLWSSSFVNVALSWLGVKYMHSSPILQHWQFARNLWGKRRKWCLVSLQLLAHSVWYENNRQRAWLRSETGIICTSHPAHLSC